MRFTLDVWESYLGGPLTWHFAEDYGRLEISILPSLDNATAGYGFLEVGEWPTEAGPPSSFCLNFDVLAHEVGHLILYSLVGLPDLERTPDDYYGFHESAADLVAMLATLHLEPLVEELLAGSRGNLYSYNELNRFAELSGSEQLRLASNQRRMADFAHGWHKEHALSQPLTGALFDILVDVFHEELLAERLIDPALEDLVDRVQHEPAAAELLQALFDQAYGRDPAALKAALLAARDWLGLALVAVWRELRAEDLTYGEIGARLLAFDRMTNGGRYGRLIRNNLAWRQIGLIPVGPRLTPPDERSHVHSVRTGQPVAVPSHGRRLSYRDRWRRAHGS